MGYLVPFVAMASLLWRTELTREGLAGLARQMLLKNHSVDPKLPAGRWQKSFYERQQQRRETQHRQQARKARVAVDCFRRHGFDDQRNQGSGGKSLQPAALDTSATEQGKAEHGGRGRNERGADPHQQDVTAAPPSAAHSGRAG